MKKAVFIVLMLLVLAVAGYYFFPEKAANMMIDFGASRSGLIKKQVKIDDHTIVYYEGGNGPSIMLLHGYTADKNNWLLFAYYLDKKYHLVIPDIPGYGESSQLTSASYTLDNQIERLHKFAQAVHLEKFHIVGNSMGGCFAGHYAARYPDEILSLGLFAAAGVMPLQINDTFKHMKNGNNQLLLKDKNDFDRLMGLAFHKVPVFPYPIQHALIQKSLADRSFYEKTLKDFLPDHFSLEKSLSSIKAPTLILWGENDRILDVSSVPVFEKGIRNYKTVILKDCGHVPMIEEPKETVVQYTAFIDGLKN